MKWQDLFSQLSQYWNNGHINTKSKEYSFGSEIPIRLLPKPNASNHDPLQLIRPIRLWIKMGHTIDLRSLLGYSHFYHVMQDWVMRHFSEHLEYKT